MNEALAETQTQLLQAISAVLDVVAKEMSFPSADGQATIVVCAPLTLMLVS